MARARARGRETLIWRPEGGWDPLGNPLPAGDPVTYTRCAVFPRYASEAEGRASTTIVGYGAIVPDPDAPITSQGTLEWRGEVFKVDGEPGKWFHFDAKPAGLEVALKKAAG